MTVKEFSDSFDTLLNSYASKAIFGDQAGDTEIVLDEYEKSVLLTQAQDNVIKSYFEKHTNQLGQGFDDSSRRQVDFSSLIKVATLHPADDQTSIFDNRGIIYKLPTVQANDGNEYSRVLYILNEALVGYTGNNQTKFIIGEGSTSSTRMTIDITNNGTEDIVQVTVVADPKLAKYTCNVNYDAPTATQYGQLYITVGDSAYPETPDISDPPTGVKEAIIAALSTAASNFTINVQGSPAITMLKQNSYTLLTAGWSNDTQNQTRFVIVPINYKEYDREMTKAYANPLKKQAWRLFQNVADGYDIYSELIPIWNVKNSVADLTYKIRYVERPTPIVLVDLPNNLTVDGYNKVMGCNLNPIIHPEILHEAVRLAIESRASAVARAEAYRNAEQRQNR